MKKSFTLFILLGLLVSSVTFAQNVKTEEGDLYSLPLEEISNIQVNAPGDKDESIASPEIVPEREVVTTRIVNFPRQLVYRAWTEPDHLKNWWTSDGFTNTFHIYNFPVGERPTLSRHDTDKGNAQNDCAFVTIREPERLAWDRQSKPLLVDVTFEEIAENKTRITIKQKFAASEECNKLTKFVPAENEENMNRLEAELKKMK